MTFSSHCDIKKNIDITLKHPEILILSTHTHTLTCRSLMYMAGCLLAFLWQTSSDMTYLNRIRQKCWTLLMINVIRHLSWKTTQTEQSDSHFWASNISENHVSVKKTEQKQMSIFLIMHNFLVKLANHMFCSDVCKCSGVL